MTIDALPSAPLPSDSAATFNTKAFNLVAALSAFVTQANALGSASNTDALTATAKALEAVNAAVVSTGSANFKGAWSSLTGALAIPASVSHLSKVWVLTESISNVTTEVPGTSSKWIAIPVNFDSPGVIGGVTPNIGNFTTVNCGIGNFTSVKTANTFSFKNRIINGGFTINQRGYITNTSLSAGVYAHDRWKAGVGGCTYTFTQNAAGVHTIITITAGSLQQVIEGCNMPEGGTYVLSWTGTAQARFNGGSYGSSPLVVTGITAGTNATVEFNTGTVGSIQLEVGSTVTPFDIRDYGGELIMCQRYYQQNDGSTSDRLCPWMPQVNNGTVRALLYVFPVTMRATPTATATGDYSPITVSNQRPSSIFIYLNTGGVGDTGSIFKITASAEL